MLNVIEHLSDKDLKAIKINDENWNECQFDLKFDKFEVNLNF